MGKIPDRKPDCSHTALIKTCSDWGIRFDFAGTVNANNKLEKQWWRVKCGENINRCGAPTLVEQLRTMAIFGNIIRVKRLILHLSKQQVLGWLAEVLSTSIAGFWALWGIIENFHEGWFHTSLPMNVGQMFVQYLSPMIIFVSLGMLYWYGRPQPRRAAYWIIAGLPTLPLIICGVEPIMRVAGRVNDENLEERLIEGNGVRLKWAAEGVIVYDGKVWSRRKRFAPGTLGYRRVK